MRVCQPIVATLPYPTLAYETLTSIRARLRDEHARRRLRASVTTAPTPRGPTRHGTLPYIWYREQPIACMRAPQRF